MQLHAPAVRLEAVPAWRETAAVSQGPAWPYNNFVGDNLAFTGMCRSNTTWRGGQVQRCLLAVALAASTLCCHGNAWPDVSSSEIDKNAELWQQDLFGALAPLELDRVTNQVLLPADTMVSFGPTSGKKALVLPYRLPSRSYLLGGALLAPAAELADAVVAVLLRHYAAPAGTGTARGLPAPVPVSMQPALSRAWRAGNYKPVAPSVSIADSEQLGSDTGDAASAIEVTLTLQQEEASSRRVGWLALLRDCFWERQQPHQDDSLEQAHMAAAVLADVVADALGNGGAAALAEVVVAPSPGAPADSMLTTAAAAIAAAAGALQDDTWAHGVELEVQVSQTTRRSRLTWPHVLLLGAAALWWFCCTCAHNSS